MALIIITTYKEVTTISARFIAGKLKWDISGVFEDIEVLEKKLQEDIQVCPKQHQKKLHKLRRWLAQISDILEKLNTIETDSLPKIEKTFQYQFQSVDLVKILFFQSSIQKVFTDLEKCYICP
ncbi:MAG: hypothetical protein HWN65_20825 [Candidatus Helarchaeota archaeon]|nr:hypothetical protein [Candidatus Helarchaeota archaeon]